MTSEEESHKAAVSAIGLEKNIVGKAIWPKHYLGSFHLYLKD